VRVSAANAAAWTPFLARRTLSRSCVAFLALGIHSAHRRRASPAYSQPVRISRRLPCPSSRRSLTHAI
ncbi:hypothetical protein OH76DRAFT_1562235, partial [Lentinus brumalis]